MSYLVHTKDLTKIFHKFADVIVRPSNWGLNYFKPDIYLPYDKMGRENRLVLYSYDDYCLLGLPTYPYGFMVLFHGFVSNYYDSKKFGEFVRSHHGLTYKPSVEDDSEYIDKIDLNMFTYFRTNKPDVDSYRNQMVLAGLTRDYLNQTLSSDVNDLMNKRSLVREGLRYHGTKGDIR